MTLRRPGLQKLIAQLAATVLCAIALGGCNGGVDPANGSSSGGSGSGCDPNYKGACLDPNASDYDCAGGSGNGPKYVEGPVQVVGSDTYGLDRDGDGTGCD